LAICLFLIGSAFLAFLFHCAGYRWAGMPLSFAQRFLRAPTPKAALLNNSVTSTGTLRGWALYRRNQSHGNGPDTLLHLTDYL
jgi:hypothetical protein